MKKLISLIGLVLICQCALAQSFSQNLQKYWWYRYRLVNDFMKVGLGFGKAFPLQKGIMHQQVIWWKPVIFIMVMPQKN